MVFIIEKDMLAFIWNIQINDQILTIMVFSLVYLEVGR